MTKRSSTVSLSSSASSRLVPAYPLTTPDLRAGGTFPATRAGFAGTIHHDFAPPTLDASPGGSSSIGAGRPLVTPDLSAYPIKGTTRLIQTVNAMIHPRRDDVEEEGTVELRRCGHPRLGKAKHRHRRRAR
jgi:hypothetical protein